MLYALILTICTAQLGCVEAAWPLYGDERFENDPAPFHDEQTCLAWAGAIDKAMREGNKGWVQPGSARCDFAIEQPNG